MKKKIIILLSVMLAGMLSSELQAQAWRRHRSVFDAGDDYHFGYISGSVGYSMLQTAIPNAMPHGNVGGSVGAGYEFRNSGFWANVGAYVSFHRSSLLVDEYIRDFEGLDTQGKATTFHYRVNQVDELEWNFLDVPVMLGYYIRGFHIGAGVKVSYAINPMTYAAGTYNLSATNHNLGATFENMPDRGYTDYPCDSRVSNRLNVGAGLVGEIGYDLLSSMATSSRVCQVLKMSFYFEYGLNNLPKEWETPEQAVEPDVNDATKAVIHPYLNTFAKPLRTVPFFTGVKLTYMIGGSRTARVGFHHGCMCYN